MVNIEGDYADRDCGAFETYEQALEAGMQEALKIVRQDEVRRH